MKWLDTRYVLFADMRLPEDWPALLADERVKRLATSTADTDGPVNLPVLNAVSGGIVSGKHRLAAEAVRGMDGATCRFWIGTPAEERVLRAADNAWPRDDHDAWITEMTEARAALIEERRAISGQADRKGPGRPKSVMAEAREEVARMEQTTPEAIRSAQRRTEEKRNPKPPKLDVRMPDGSRYEPESPLEAPPPEGPFEEPEPAPPPPAAPPAPPPEEPKERSLLRQLQDYAGSPRSQKTESRQDAETLLGRLVALLDTVEEQYQPYKGAASAGGKPEPAARVWLAAHSASIAARELKSAVYRLVGEMEGIVISLRMASLPSKPGQGPKTGLRGRKLR